MSKGLPLHMLTRLASGILLVSLLWAGCVGTVHADVNNFVINNFSADEALSRTDPQGELHVIETITVTFHDSNHGILRALPTRYRGNPLKLRDITVASSTGAPARFTTYSSHDNTVIKIGDPNRMVTGQQTYVIRYTVANVITFYNDHDELYWDINGDQWGQPTQAVHLTLYLPDGSVAGPAKPLCLAGSYGTTTSPCTIAEAGHSLIADTSTLAPYQTLTVVAGFQKGYFHPQTFSEWVRDRLTTILQVVGLPLLVVIVGFGYWYRYGRDVRGKGTIVPEYAPPEGITPLEAGTVMDFKTDNRDITATIIDLALRGYIKIYESKQDRLLAKDKLEYSLELLNTDLASLKGYETQLLTALFATYEVGARIDINNAKNKYYTTAQGIRRAVDMQLAQRGYFRGDPARFTKIGAGVVVAMFLGIYLSPRSWFSSAIFIGILLSAPIVWWLLKIMPARTALGVAAKEQLQGLKLYLVTAEADRIKMLQGPDAAYAANHDAPQKTVELFEKLLPYAMVFGVEKEWAKQFKNIYTQPPSWYSGNWTTFSVGAFTGNLSSGLQNSFNTAFTAPSSSGSSGFGGGFSGGGGGGGGGGGW